MLGPCDLLGLRLTHLPSVAAVSHRDLGRELLQQTGVEAPLEGIG